MIASVFLCDYDKRQEHELNVVMFLNGNILSQNLFVVFLFRNLSTFNSCSCNLYQITKSDGIYWTLNYHS